MLPAILWPATVRAPNAMVASADGLATQAGMAVLQAGGNAVDAALATNAVLAVTAPHLCGMGGDLFALVHAPGMDRPAALNASGRAGSGADAAALRAEGRRAMPFKLDARSITVPGCVDGWIALHARFGSLPLAALLRPAIGYAADGFPCSPLLAASAAALQVVPGSADITGAGRLSPGQRLTRPGVAATLGAIASGGRDAFYLGPFGTGLRRLAGHLFDEADLAGSQADWVDALGLEVWGARLWTTPPNSQGYLTLASSWIAAGLPLPAGADGPDEPAWAHLLVEAARQASFDRPHVLHEAAAGAALVDPGRLEPRRRRIATDGAGDLGVAHGPGDTTYLCVVDADRMGVSLIQSNASGFGSHLWEPTTGINLHNRGMGFSLVEGHPAEWAPGRRPPHTLSPALVTTPDGRRLRQVLGTMGGDGQPQILLQVLARLLGAGQSPAVAVSSGRFVLAPHPDDVRPDGATGAHPGFDTWQAGGRVAVHVEGHAPPSWGPGLAERGHLVVARPAVDSGFGHAHVIVVNDDGLEGAADPRTRIGQAAGS